MVHDIRSPLQSLICSLDFMRECEVILKDPELANTLDISAYCAEFILSHVGNFLDLSKTETSKIELSPTPTELLELIKKIVQMHSLKAESANLYLKLKATENMPELVMLDKNRFT